MYPKFYVYVPGYVYEYHIFSCYAAPVNNAAYTCTVCYYLFISGSELGTGTFVASITGLSTWDILGAIALQMLMYLMLVGLTSFMFMCRAMYMNITFFLVTQLR